MSGSLRKVIQSINREFLETVDIHEDETSPALIAFYYTARRREVSAAVASFEGYKLAFSVDASADIGDSVKRGLLLSDLVVLSHSDIPSEASTAFFVVPSWFPKDSYDFSALNHYRVPPHLVLGGTASLMAGSEYKLADGTWRGVPALAQSTILPMDIANWCLHDGRELVNSGDVIYDPLLPPSSWEQYLLTCGINFQGFYDTYRLLPQSDTHLDDAAALALLQLDIPLLENVDVKTLRKIREDEHEAFLSFRSHLLSAFNDIEASTGSENLSRALDRITEEQIRPGLEELRGIQRRVKKLKVTELLNIAFVSAPTILSLFLTSPELKVLGPTLSLSGAAKSYLDHLADNLKTDGELRSKPMYLLWKAAGKPTSA